MFFFLYSRLCGVVVVRDSEFVDEILLLLLFEFVNLFD